MARRFFAVSVLSEMTAFDDVSFIDALGDLDGVFVAVHGAESVGMAAGMVFPAWYNRRSLAAQELFWWVEPEYRGTGAGQGLYGAFEAWARGKGAETLIMGATETQRPETMARWYARKGYQPMERLFWKRL